MTTSRILPFLATLIVPLALAACGGPADRGAAASDGGESATTAAAVTIADLAYSPADVAVTAGSAVTWTNDDEAPHTVTFDSDGVDSSGELVTGDRFTATFDQPGTFTYLCAIHPDMTGTVTVS